MNQLATDGIAPVQNDSAYFTRVFAWMAAGLAVTGAVSAAVYSSGTALHVFEGSNGPTIFIILAVLELALLAGLVGLVQHMGLFEAGAMFLAYCVLNGVTFSVIFLAYTTTSIVSAFLVTAAMFGALALWGYTTKAGSHGVGQLPLHGADRPADRARRQPLLAEQHAVLGHHGGRCPALLRLHRLRRPAAQEVRAAARRRLRRGREGAIVGALALYLDFVNLFLYVLRILGRAKR